MSCLTQITVLIYQETVSATFQNIKYGFVSASVRMSSPKKEFAHANHVRVYCPALSRQKDSCMNPVPALEALSISRHIVISLSSVLTHQQRGTIKERLGLLNRREERRE